MYRISGRLALALLLASGSLQSSAAEAPRRLDSEPVDRFAPLTAPVLGEDDQSRLEAGETIVRDLPPSDGVGIGVLVMGLIAAPPDQVWVTMRDCEAQDEFLPRIAYAAVEDRDGNDHTCELVVDLPFPVEDVRTATRQHVRRLPDGGYQRYWKLLPGDGSCRRDSGSWTLHPYADGRRTLLVNRLDLLPKSSIPEWLLRAAHVQHAPETFDAIRARVREGLTRPDTK